MLSSDQNGCMIAELGSSSLASETTSLDILLLGGESLSVDIFNSGTGFVRFKSLKVGQDVCLFHHCPFYNYFTY